MKLSTFLIALLLFTSCSPGGRGGSDGRVYDASTDAADSASLIVPVYAKGFSVKYLAGGVRLVDIQDPAGENAATYRFALLPGGAEATAVPDGYTPIVTPVKSVICMTSLQLSGFICLGACRFVSGVTSTRHLFNEEMNSRIREGKTAKIGIEGSFDNEIIISLSPDVIFISPFKRGGYESMKDTGIPLVPHLGYKEMTPLGQAEWMKFIAMFIGMEEEANSRFSEIETRYNELKRLAADSPRRPVVFSGEIRGGNWYAVGGKSFLAQLFRDAGADYFLRNDCQSGGVTLDFETVYSQAESAEFWRIVNSYDGEYSYDALKASDARYADFRAFRERKVVYCNMRRKPFYESMPMEPDIVLADLIRAFHPDLLPEHEPKYYEILK